jgi:hypothetical protein
MKGDVRGYQVAVVADSLLDRLLPVLEEERWGVIQLPPNGLDEETTAAWLEQVEEHVAEFKRNEYALVVLDDGSHEVGLQAPLLRATGGIDEVREFLSQYAIQPPSTSRLSPET